MPPALIALRSRGSPDSDSHRTSSQPKGPEGSSLPGLLFFGRFCLEDEMNGKPLLALAAAAIAVAPTLAGAQPSRSPAGLWDASVVVTSGPAGGEQVKVDVPF